LLTISFYVADLLGKFFYNIRISFFLPQMIKQTDKTDEVLIKGEKN